MSPKSPQLQQPNDIQPKQPTNIQTTEQERQQILSLKQRELKIREKEVGSRNRLILSIAILTFLTLIGIVVVVLFYMFRPQTVPVAKNEDLSLISTRDALVKTMTSVANASLMGLVTESSVPKVTPIPTNTIMPSQTSTIMPSQTPNVDTPPNSILNVGETWRSSGLELTLASTQLGPGNYYYDTGIGIKTSFLLRNRRNQDLSIRFSTNNFTAQDNSGNRLTVRGCMDGCAANSGNEVVRIINSGGSLDFGIDGGGYVEVDTANPSITEVIISVSGISSINNAQWRIPLYH